MFGLFNRDPATRLRKKYYLTIERALQARRAGKLLEYATLTEEAEALKAKLEALPVSQQAA